MSKWAELVNASGEDEWLEMCNEALAEVQRTHAHKLAEKIRKYAEEKSDYYDYQTSHFFTAADLVDPEVEN